MQLALEAEAGATRLPAGAAPAAAAPSSQG